MAWYNNILKREPEISVIPEAEEKLNPAQPHFNEKVIASNQPSHKYQTYYDTLEVVNRSVNMIVDDAAEVPAHIGDQRATKGVVKGIKRVTVEALINERPNPFQDINTFRRQLITDYLIDGNIFMYFDGVYLYHLPASKVIIHASETTYIQKYTYNETIDYKPSEIIHIKENSFSSIYRGTPRLRSALDTLKLVASMRTFQDNFFKNGAVPGLVIKSPNTLSPKIKERLIESWQMKYSPSSGGRRPLILDGGLDIDQLSKVNFKEMDFQKSIEDNEKIILKAMGVPPIMLDSGNNANLKPNMRMYYLETVMPIVKKINYGLERFFGFYVTEDVTQVISLQPELSEQSNYFTGLVNGGVITPNEARVKLGYEEMEGHDELRIPANIAGSAGNPSEGGRPTEDED